MSYGPLLNAAAVLLSCCGNVPPERAAQVMGMLLGIPVSAGWVDKAAARVSAQLGKAGFDEAMLAALTAEEVLAADETPVNVLDKTVPPAAEAEEREEADPEEKEGKAAAGAPHVLITRTPDGRLTFLQAIGSRRKDAIAVACRPEGDVPGFVQMMSWAKQFMSAGAGAFVGPSWTVRPRSARAFADEFYRALVTKQATPGTASLQCPANHR